MKKSLIALTLAALPVAAMADVTLYGTIKAGVEVSRVKDAGTYKAQGGKSKTATQIADFGSKIGFKGQEDLGNGMKAIWQLEQKASIAGTNSGWGNRQSFIGLKGGFGTVRAGNLNTVLKDSGDNVNAWESGSNTEDVLGLGTIGRVESREISVRYDSPVFAGFSGSVQYVPRDNANDKDKYTHKQSSRESYHAGLKYENAGFFGQYAGSFAKYADLNNDAERVAVNTPNAHAVKDYQVHRVVAGYDANDLYVSVAGQYEAAKNNEVGNLNIGKKHEQTQVAATAAYRFGNVTPRVSYAHGFKAKVNGEKAARYQYDQVIVGADYDFSKRTSALVSVGWLQEGKGKNKTEKTASMVGLSHKF
ncbi:porin [Neisseria meningitidis]|uniref:trimeric porin PorB n=1 Tax=Neisseria meningitidis TaxID=487 RepID=UPI001C5A1BE7|nr:trimeric porin PorB [Neisseria meningitidis]MBW3867266.1 porin [Neisseria meningitidis]